MLALRRRMICCIGRQRTSGRERVEMHPLALDRLVDSTMVNLELKAYYDKLEITFLIAFVVVVGTYLFVVDARKRNKQGNVGIAISIFLCLTFGTFFFSMIAILCGAPVFDRHYETCLWSALQTLFCVLPVFLVHGADPQVLYDIYVLGVTQSRTQRLIYLSGIGSIFGSLLGTSFIPLDVNEMWQQWPITVFAGSVCGYVAGACLWWMKCGQ